MYQSKIIFQSKKLLYPYEESVSCIYHIKHYVDVCFTVMMVNSCKGYSSSFSFVLLVCVSSVSSDNGGSRQEAEGEREIFSRHSRSTQTESRPSTECLWSSEYRAFPLFTSSTSAQKQDFSFPLFLGKKKKKSYFIDFEPFTRIITFLYGIVTSYRQFFSVTLVHFSNHL